MLEWLSAAAGAAVALAFLITIALSIGDEAAEILPRLTAKPVRIVAGEGSEFHSLVVIVRNHADRTAKQVEVEGTIGDETSSLTLDYVPARSQAEGVLLFKADPRSASVEVRLTGYQLP